MYWYYYQRNIKAHEQYRFDVLFYPTVRYDIRVLLLNTKRDTINQDELPF